MSYTDLQSYLLETVEILDLPEGDAVVYPTGAIFGRSYRIPGNKAAEFYHWRLAEVSPSPTRLWLTRALVFAGLIAAILVGRILSGYYPGIDFIVVFAALGVLTTGVIATTLRRFKTAFPMAARYRDPNRYRRLIQAYICHPAFALWKCALFSAGFAMAAVTLAGVLSHSAASLPAQSIGTLAGAIILLFALATLAAAPGWIALNHILFWRRTGRLPQPEDAQTLA